MKHFPLLPEFVNISFMDRRAKGIACILSSAFCFAMMNMFVRLSGDIPSIEKSFFRNFIAALAAFVIVIRDRRSIAIKKDDIPLLIMRSVLGTIGILGNFYAVDHLVLSDATMLNKMAPFFTLILSMLFLKEKLPLKTMLIVIGAFIGSLFVIKPTFQNANLTASMIGFIGGFGAGAAYTCVRALGKKGVKGPVVVLFFSVFSCLATLPYLIFDYHPITPLQLLTLLLAGLAAAGGQFSITAAYTFAPAKEISVFDYSQVIFTAIIGWVVFSQIPDMLSFIGYIIIIVMALIMFLGERKETGNAA